MSESDYHIVWLLRRLFRALADRSNQKLQDLGVSAADRATMEFLYPDLKLSVPEIAARYQVSRQHVQVVVNGLLGRSLLHAQPNPQHKRSSLLRLTQRGRELFAAIRESESVIVERIFADVSDDDLEVTRNTLDTVFKQLN